MPEVDGKLIFIDELKDFKLKNSKLKEKIEQLDGRRPQFSEREK